MGTCAWCRRSIICLAWLSVGVGKDPEAAQHSARTLLLLAEDADVPGKPRREGFGFITDFQEDQPNTNLVAINVSIQGTGALTFSTQ